MSATESPAEILERLAILRAEQQSAGRPRQAPIAVTGGRDYTPTAAELQAFLFCFRRLEGSVLLHGDAHGVDRIAAAFARRHGVPVRAFPADWNLYGKAAGPIRNQQLVTSCIYLIAFPGGRGTADAVTQARRLGRPVHLIEDELLRMRTEVERDHLGA